MPNCWKGRRARRRGSFNNPLRNAGGSGLSSTYFGSIGSEIGVLDELEIVALGIADQHDADARPHVDLALAADFGPAFRKPTSSESMSSTMKVT